MASPLAGYVNHVLVESYRELLLNDTVVGQVVAASWNFLSAYEGADEAEMGSCPRVTPKVREFSLTTSTTRVHFLARSFLRVCFGYREVQQYYLSYVGKHL